MNIAEEYVASGAAFLDEKYPAWRQRIDVDTIDISDGDHCILGQLYGSYSQGVDLLRLGDGAVENFGFIYSTRAPSGALTDAWQALLADAYPVGTLLKTEYGVIRRVYGVVPTKGGESVYVLEMGRGVAGGEFDASGNYLACTKAMLDAEYTKVPVVELRAGDVLKDKEGRFYLVDKELRTWCLDEGVWSQDWERHNNRKLTLQENGSYDSKRYSELF